MARQKQILRASKVPSVTEISTKLGFKHQKETTTFNNATRAFRMSYRTPNGSTGDNLTSWYDVQEELKVMAETFLESGKGKLFWSHSWMQNGDLKYPEDKETIIELLKQLFWKQNNYALNNRNYGKKKYGGTPVPLQNPQPGRLVAPLLSGGRQNSHESPGPIATSQHDPAPNVGFQVRGASDTPTLLPQPQTTAQDISIRLDNGVFWVIMPDGSEESWPNGGIRCKTISEVTDEISKIVGRDDIEKLRVTLKVPVKVSFMTKTMGVHCDMQGHWDSLNNTFDQIIKDNSHSNMGALWQITINPVYKPIAPISDETGNSSGLSSVAEMEGDIVF